MARGQPSEESYTPQVSPEDLPRKITPEMRPDSLAPAIQNVAETLNAKYQADSATYAGDQVAAFRLKAISDLDDAKAAAPPGDPGDFTGAYLKQYDQNAKGLIDASQSNPTASRIVHNSLSQLRDTLAEHTMEWEATQRVAYQNNSLQSNLDKQLPLVRAHPEIATQVGSTLMDQLNATRNDPSVKLKFGTQMDTQLTRSASLGLADRDPMGVYTQLLTGKTDDPTLSRLQDPQARNEVLEQAQAGVVKGMSQAVMAAYRNAGPAAGTQAYKAMDSLELPGTPEQQESMREKIRDGVRSAHGELVAEQQQALAPKLMAVEESLRSGAPAPGTRANIWDLYHNNALEPGVAGSYLGQLDAAQRKETVDESGMQLIQDAWDGKHLLDPKDSDQKTDANNWFIDRTTAAKLDQGSQGWINLGAEFARRTGMIPEPIAAWTRSVLVGAQDPKTVMAAVDSIDRMRAASPRGFQYFDDDAKLGAMSDSIEKLTKAGVDPARAIDMARTEAANGDKDRARLAEMWKTTKVFGNSDAAIDDVLRKQIKDDPRLSDVHWYGDKTPVRPPAMQSDFYNSTRSYFNYNGGDIEAAQKSAARDIGNTWGLTRMNGAPQIVRYAPERMFRAPDGGPGLSADDIRTDVAQTVLKNPDSFMHWDEDKHGPVPFHVKPENVQLVESPQTSLTNGRTWGLAYSNDEGVTESLFGKNGKPLQYNLPVSAQDYKALRVQATKDAVAKAQANYDAQYKQEEQSRALLRFQQDQLEGR